MFPIRAALLLTLLVPGIALCKPALTFTLAHGSANEQRIQREVERLAAQHDLDKWLQTRTIRIAAGEIPHSHPILTLHTRHLGEPNLLLSTLVHEQMHWLLSNRAAPAAAAIKELRALYPVLPVGYPEGADSEQANWEHLIVIYLEMMACRELLGTETAAKVMAFWSNDHYTALVKTVLRDEARIGAIVRKTGLLP